MSKHDQSGVPIIRPLKKSDPDLRKLARALIALAIAKNQSEQDAAKRAAVEREVAEDTTLDGSEQ